jgi:hypothetical protein
MFHSLSDKRIATHSSGDSNLGDRASADPVRASMVSRVESLARSIRQDYKAKQRGGMKDAILRVAEEFLIQDPTDRSFSLLHQSCLSVLPANFCIKPLGYQALSAADFETFLSEKGPALIEKYKEWKWRGYTSCAPISDETKKLLNRMTVKPCADIEGISHHAFDLVLVEGQPYWVDFTFDQFIDYERIQNAQILIDEPVTYAGVLVMPIDRMAFKFDKLGSLVG